MTDINNYRSCLLSTSLCCQLHVQDRIEQNQTILCWTGPQSEVSIVGKLSKWEKYIVTFVDFKKAHDSVDRLTIFKILHN